MATLPATVRFTANFESNLEAIADFWAQCDAPAAFDALLDQLDGRVIQILERHPRIGRNFLARKGESAEIRWRTASLREGFGAMEVREYLFGDYLILYSISVDDRGDEAAPRVDLLAIKHHRQLSFDFDGLWQASAGEG